MLKKLFGKKNVTQDLQPSAALNYQAQPVALEGTDDEAIYQIGLRMLEIARANPDPKNVKDKLADWAMEDVGFKVQLFRFIDAYPKLAKDPDLVYSVLMEYLNDPSVNMPAGAGTMLKMGAMAKGVVNSQMKANIEAMGSRFIAGINAQDALPHLKKRWVDEDICVTADLLGEMCVSEHEAQVYRDRYMDLIVNLSESMKDWPRSELLEQDNIGEVPRCNVSIKLSSLADKYTPLDLQGSVERCLKQLRPLLEEAAKRNVLINFDVEQYELKDLNLAVFKRCCEEVDFPAGIAMQAYLRSGEEDARKVVAWAKQNNKQVTVRLVKGAYWDHEVIHAEEQGWPVPVWTNKADSDACFERMSKIFIDAAPRKAGEAGVKLALGSHNLRSIATVMHLAEKAGLPKSAVELQMLYGMGHGLKLAAKKEGYRVREYVPVGELIPGMAYLVRRLLENTSNESWLLQGLSKDADPRSVLGSPHDPKRPDRRPTSEFVMLAGVEGVGNGAPFTNEPCRDFADAKQWQAYKSAVDAAVVPVVENSATIQDAEAAIEKAHAALPSWRDTPVRERANILCKAAELMRQRRDELSAMMVKESAKPWKEADADTCEAIDFLEYYARACVPLCEPKRITGFLGEKHLTWNEARGVCTVISPWNFPLAICVGLSCAPLVAGCPVIVKPAAPAPGIAKIMCEIMWQAGIPKEVLHFMPGPGSSVGARLVNHPKITNIAFTGSKQVGLDIWQEAGVTRPEQGQLKRVVCEMGGKNAIIVDDSADLDEAVIGARYSAFGFSGQKCSACSRLIVLDTVYDEFIERFVESCKSLEVGDPQQPGSDMGPVINHAVGEVIQQYIAWGKENAKMLLGDDCPRGEVLGKPLIGPHVFEVSDPQCKLMQEEIFGPVVAILKVASFDEALQVANDVPYKLTGAVYSRTPSHLERAQLEFRVGNLYLNRSSTGAIVGRQPFGGFGMSGAGTKAGSEQNLLSYMDPRLCAENTMRRGFAPELTS